MFLQEVIGVITGSPCYLYEPHKQRNMASNNKVLHRIFYNPLRQLKVKILNKNDLPYSLRVLLLLVRNRQ